MKKCIVIYNPHSGKKARRPFLIEFNNILNQHGYECEIIFTQHKNHACEIMEHLGDDVGLVISVGGDGTFNEVMTGNFKREKRLLLAHIPQGTTNDIGSMFGYNKNMLNNLKDLLNGEVRRMDIGVVNNHPFIYVAGFGKFMNVPYETSRDMKVKFGYLAYLVEGVKSFISKTNLYELEYEVNGEKYKGLYSFILISNANRIAGINNFYKDVKLDDDQFEVLFCSVKSKKDIVKSLYYLRTTDINNVPGFYFHKTNNLKIKFTRPLKHGWCVDGEEFDKNKKEYDIRIERNVKIMLPKKNINKLFKKNNH